MPTHLTGVLWSINTIYCQRFISLGSILSTSYYLCLNLYCMGMAGYGCGYGHDNDGNVLKYGDHQDAGITGMGMNGR